MITAKQPQVFVVKDYQPGLSALESGDLFRDEQGQYPALEGKPGMIQAFNDSSVLTLTDSGYLRFINRKGRTLIEGELSNMAFCMDYANQLQQCIEGLKPDFPI